MSDTPLFDQVCEAPAATAPAATAPAVIAAPTAPPVLTVTELTARVKQLLEGSFGAVCVGGEISNLKRPKSGHIYFDLKDSGAVIRAVLWKSTAQRLKFPVVDGIEVIIHGWIDVYAPRGEYQIRVNVLQPKGDGAQQLALRLLKEKLMKLGFFSADRKKPLPRFPGRIALVTSPTGAAVRDMLEKIMQRWPVAEVWICPVRVQGVAAPLDIVGALRTLNRLSGIDVLVLGRGGGSTEDLAAFNHEAVAQSIFECRIPIISAVGHEIDVTIADLVADCRASTPTDAIVRATPDQMELMQGLENRRQRLRTLLIERVQTIRQRVDVVAERRIFRYPLERLRERERKLDETEERLQRAMRQRLALAGQRTEAHAARLQALSPLNVLARGYSLTRTADGFRLVHSADQVTAGERIEVLLADGRLLAAVERVLPPLESLSVTSKP